MKIVNARVFRDNAFSLGQVETDGQYFGPSRDGVILDAQGMYAIPGLIDIHFHGCAGYDFCQGTQEAIEKIAEYEKKAGVLAICPATMTLPEKELAQVALAAAAYQGKTGADLVGINMEGPFLNPKRAGAQDPKYIQKPNAELFLRLQELSGGLFKLCDLAPEMEGAVELIRALRGKIPVLSIAHTACDYETACAVMEEGVNHLTHCYNAMPGIAHRAPGPILAALEKGANVELITDGTHIHPAVVRATFRLFGDERVILVSDSTMACGLPDGTYTLAGQSVALKGRRVTLTGQPQVIAGSGSNLMDCLRCAVREMDIPLESAVRATTLNPARAIGIEDRYGSIQEGKYANLLLLNSELELVKIIHRGNLTE